MSGRHRFQGLIAGFGPERRRRVEAKKAELMVEMPLRELRQAMAIIRLSEADHQDFGDIRGVFMESHGDHDDR